jgi:pimeloyl-ACP methyl ester carboxylesterase
MGHTAACQSIGGERPQHSVIRLVASMTLMMPNPSCVKAVLLVALSAGVAAGQPHALVFVGDHRLDVVRSGAGGPAVVFETGLADSLDVWLPLLRTMSAYTTVIAYSRAGFGRSDAGYPDHSVPHAAADLHELLHRLPIKPPYILVARSYGSLISRLYTSLYPTDVAGIVLVDGTHEQQVQRFGMIDSSYPREFRAYYDSVLARLAPGAEAAEIRESVRIQVEGTVPGLKSLPDIPIATFTSSAPMSPRGM